MIDLGISKIALIAVVALVVVGPERLPKVARFAGNLLGRAQRYMSEVKSEVNRQVELEELKKMQQEATSAMKDVESTIKTNFQDVEAGLHQTSHDVKSSLSGYEGESSSTSSSETSSHYYDDFADGGFASTGVREPKTNIRQGKESWGVKRSAMPLWFKRSSGIKTRVQSGAARVKRFRRAASAQKITKNFF